MSTTSRDVQAQSDLPATDDYALGYSEAEHRRLARQGAFYRDLTEDFLHRAGLAPGMSVLDLGCGVGDVALIAAELVGPSGAVLGIDRSADTVRIAERRAAAEGRNWVRFASTELDAFSTNERFDAVIGRLILLYLPDPSATLNRLTGYLRPGGLIAFQEMEMSLVRFVPDMPLHRRCGEWILTTFRRAGIEVDMGTRLPSIYLGAGLPRPKMTAGTRVESGEASPVYEYFAMTVGSLLPLAERFGIATAEDVGIATLADRLREEATEHQMCILPPTLIGAWTRISDMHSCSTSPRD